MKCIKGTIIASMAIMAMSVSPVKAAKKVFWEEGYQIKRMNYDGTAQETILKGHRPKEVYLDNKNEHVYWADHDGVIYRTDRDGSNTTLIVAPDSASRGRLTDIAMDSEYDFLFWGIRDEGIKKLDLNSGEISLIAAGEYTANFEIDRGQLFWIEAYEGLIKSIKMTGEDLRIVYGDATLYKSYGKLSVDRYNGMLYFCDFSTGKMVSTDQSGNNFEELFPLKKNFYYGNIEYLQGRFFIDEAGLDRLISVNLSGEDTLIVENYFNYVEALHAGIDGRIYLADPATQSVRSFASGGTDEQTHFKGDGVSFTYGMTIDNATQTMYLCTNGDYLSKTDLNGGTVTPITTWQPDDVEGVTVAKGKLYWGDDDSILYRANLDGSNIEAYPDYTKEPEYLFADTVEEKLYIIDDRGVLLRTDLECSVKPDTVLYIVGHLRGVFAYPEIGRLFVSESSKGRQGIYSYNLDGSDQETLFMSKHAIGNILIDKEENRMFFAADSAIYTANIDGSDVQMLYKSTDENLRYLTLGEIGEKSEQEVAFSCSDLSFWDVTGGNIGSSENSSDGNSSLSITPQGGHSEITSVNLKTIEVKDPTKTLAVDMWIGSNQPNPWWIGNVQMVLAIPSANIWFANAGTVQLTPLAQDEWVTVHYTLPDHVLTALNGDYNDLKISFKYTVESNSGPYLLDHMRFE